MKPVGKDKTTLPEEQEMKAETEQKETPAAVSDTDALLRELEDVLEISREEHSSPNETSEESTDPEVDADAELKPTAIEDTADKEAAEPTVEESIHAVSFASMAHAVEEAKKEPPNRFYRDAMDDETLLAELHALIGDSVQPRPIQNHNAASASIRLAPLTAPASRPVTRITPETLNNIPDDYDDLMESDNAGMPGWVKGIFILLISLLVGAMTFYAVASDVMGKIF